MSDKFLIHLTDTNDHTTSVILDDGWFSDTWDQGILGPAMLIGSGHGSFTHLGAARRVNLWDGEGGGQLVVMDGVSRYPFRAGDSGEGIFNGRSQAISSGVIQWRCSIAY